VVRRWRGGQSFRKHVVGLTPSPSFHRDGDALPSTLQHVLPRQSVGAFARPKWFRVWYDLAGGSKNNRDHAGGVGGGRDRYPDSRSRRPSPTVIHPRPVDREIRRLTRSPGNWRCSWYRWPTSSRSGKEGRRGQRDTVSPTNRHRETRDVRRVCVYGGGGAASGMAAKNHGDPRGR
jgi:hypothetical protein